ncbi:MAG: AAA family ATPase [Opitutales bacterium]
MNILTDRYSDFINCMIVALSKLNVSLEAEAQAIINKHFNLKDEEKKEKNRNEVLPIFGLEDFSWRCFISENISKTGIGREKLERIVIPKLCKKVVDILEEKLDFKNFNVINARAKEVQKFLEISDDELKVLLFFILQYDFSVFVDFFRNFSKRTNEVMASAAILCSKEAYVDAIASDSKLQRMNVIEKMQRNIFAVDESYSDFIRADSKSFIHKIAELEEPSQVFDISTFDLKENSKKIILNLLKSKKPCKILLYGKAGAGKTQFAKAIIKKLKKDIVLPRKRHENRRDTDTKLKKACLCEHIAHKLNGIALIDECDNILASKNSLFSFGTDSSDKGDLNIYLDEMKGKSIWITNCIDRIDESTKRRFSYSLEFDGLSKKQKMIALENALNNSSLSKKISLEDVYELTQKYKLSTAGSALVVNNASSIIKHENKAKILDIMEDIASSQSTLIKGKADDKVARYKPDSHFDSDIINMDMDYERLLSSLRNYNKKLNAKEVNCPMNLIFAGVPGSGKTELAKHIAHSLERHIVIKNMSDLQDKYVGETEKNIARAFKEAERENAILVIDEADSIFVDRTTASRSWEVSQTNEILAQMENYRGIFICSTNLLENIDTAAMRRFQRKINFGYLKENAREKLFKSYFLYNAEVLEDDTLKGLSYLDSLTAGDFKNIYQQVQFEEEHPSQATFVSMLKKEMSFKQKTNCNNTKIGFI